MFWLCYGEYRGQRNLGNFLKYVRAKIREKSEELSFKVYVTDSLKGIFKSMGGEVNMRYYDVISETKTEERTADEIVKGIRDKLNKISEV